MIISKKKDRWECLEFIRAAKCTRCWAPDTANSKTDVHYLHKHWDTHCLILLSNSVIVLVRYPICSSVTVRSSSLLTYERASESDSVFDH